MIFYWVLDINYKLSSTNTTYNFIYILITILLYNCNKSAVRFYIKKLNFKKELSMTLFRIWIIFNVLFKPHQRNSRIFELKLLLKQLGDSYAFS